MKTQSQRVYDFIVAHPGCTTMELQIGLRPFVSNPRARISDLRAKGREEGFLVVPVKRADNVVGYHIRLVEDMTLGLVTDAA